MRKIYTVLTVSLILVNFIIAQEKNYDSFELEGTLKEDFNNEYIYLEYGKLKDSCLIIKNKFQFQGNLTQESVQGVFSLKNRVMNTPAFYLENTYIKIRLSIKETANKNRINVKIISVEGTKSIALQNTFEEFFKKKDDKNFNGKMLKKLDSAVSINPNHGYLVSLIYRLSNNDEYDEKTLRKIYSKINKEIQSEFYKRRINENLFKQNFIEYGSTIPNIKLPNEKDSIYDVSKLKGKWILLDFWASWCAPCRQELPELKRIYDGHKTNNFEIVGISIDKNKEQWLKSIQDESIKWINLNENQSFYGKVTSKFNVQGIPTNFLINPNGKIILKNISLKNLENFLANIK
jgi:peroxiredoxin